MAAAVLEAAEQGNGRFAGVPVRVVPGLSAMQAAAARVGAPLGHDFCVVSLSDILKPWEIVERRLRAAGRPGAGASSSRARSRCCASTAPR
jgi:precorrin-3B methylase